MRHCLIILSLLILSGCSHGQTDIDMPRNTAKAPNPGIAEWCYRHPNSISQECNSYKVDALSGVAKP